MGLIKNGKFALYDQIIISLSNFLSSVVLARNVLPEELGFYVIGFLLIQFVRAVQDGVIIQPSNILASEVKEEDYKDFLSNLFFIQIFFSTISFVFTILLFKIFIINFREISWFSAVSLGFSFFTWQLQELLRRVFYIRSLYQKAVILSVTANFIRLGFMGLLLIRGKLTGSWGIFSIGLGSMGGIIFGLSNCKISWIPKIKNIASHFKYNWKLGKWIIWVSISDWLVIHLYPLISAGIISIATAGAYQALQNLVAPVHLLLRATDTYATPVAVKIFKQYGWKKLEKYIRRIYLIIGIPIMIILLLSTIFSKQLLTLFSRSNYVNLSNGTYFMALFYLLMYLFWPLQIGLKAVKKGKPLFMANTIAFMSMVTLGVILVKKWGLYGLIIGQSLNALIILIYLLLTWYTNKKVDFVQKLGD